MVIRLFARTVVCATVSYLAVSLAHADGIVHAQRALTETASGGLAGRSAVTAQGSNGALIGRRGLVADGQGNVAAQGGGGFSTALGGQGLRSRNFNRSSDGSVSANGQGSYSGDRVSADRSGSFTKSADSTATGERSTTVTNANNGVTYDASTSYTKGSGVTRSASCKDANGNTVSCGSR